MAGGARIGPAEGRDCASALPDRTAHRSNAAFGRPPALQGDHRLRQHDPQGRRAGDAGRTGVGVPDSFVHSLERDGDRHPGQQTQHRIRRPHREFRLGGDAIRCRFQSLLARAGARVRRRSHLPPGAFITRHLRARLLGRAIERGAAAQLPSRDRIRRPLLLPPPVVDVELLAIPDRVDGTDPVVRHLSGALSQIPREPRNPRSHGAQGLGLHGRWRNGRAGVARRDFARGSRATRQPHLRRQLQPPAPRWTRARQWKDHPGARGRFPRRRLERHQGHLGRALGPAAREGQGRPAPAQDGRSARRRLPELQEQGRRLYARELLRQGPETAPDGRASDR